MRALALVLVLLLSSVASASHFREWCTPGTSDPEIDAAGYYIDNDPWGDHLSIWVYEESNGIPGLQRRDEVKDDTCGHPELGDTIVL